MYRTSIRKNRRYLRTRSVPAPLRKGVSTMALILSFSLIVAIMGLSVDLGLLVQRHQQLKTAGEASALAAALERFGFEQPKGSADPASFPRRLAAEYAAANPIGTRRLKLDLNAKNDPQGDIVIGSFEPPSLGGVFRVQGSGFREGKKEEKDSEVNAVLVRTRHSQVGHGPILLLSQMAGVPSHDIFAESIAAVDRRVLGFRPVGCSRVPMLPLIVKSRAWEKGNRGQGTGDGEEEDSDEGDEGGGRDRFACDPRSGAVFSGGDGVPELELIVQIQDDESGHGQGQGNGGGSGKNEGGGDDDDDEGGNGRPGKRLKARILSLAGRDQRPGGESIAEQVVRGLSSEHLETLGGELVQGNEVPCLDCGDGTERSAQEQLSALETALKKIVGQPKVVALGRWRREDGRDAGTVENFAACVVVDSQAASKSLTIRIQPVVLHSCTTITGVGVRSNPWIGKVVLVR